MNLDFNQQLKMLDGSDIIPEVRMQDLIVAAQKIGKMPEIMAVVEAAKATPLTLRKVCTDALLAVSEEDARVSGEEKLKRWALAHKIYGQAPVELAVEEVATLKKLVGQLYGPLIVGPAFAMLEKTEK